MSDYRVEIIRKNIKNTYIRIRDDGTVTVTCPKRASEGYVRNLLKKKDGWIRKQLERVCVRDESDILDSKHAMYFGRRMIIRAVKSNFPDVYAQGDEIRVLCPSESPQLQSAMITEFYRHQFGRYCSEALERCLERAARFGIKKNPGLRIRLMKSRYGSYSSGTEMISLNLYLARFSEDIIDSVIYHEIAHIRHMNHQKGFYRLLYSLCPEYDRYNAELKKEVMRPSDRWFLE